MASRGTDKVLIKLQKSVEEGNYYEAHQMYNSISQRLMKQEKYDECIELLYSGALSLAKHNQAGSAVDLVRRMLQAYDAAGLEADEKNVGRLIQLFEYFPNNSNFTTEFVRDTIRWTSQQGPHPTGDPYLHHVVGMRYFKLKKYYDAETHFVFGTVDSAKALGFMDYQWSEEGYPVENGYFIARAVLQYLVLKKLKHANVAMGTFLHALEVAPEQKQNVAPFTFGSRQIDLYKSKLINFCQLLLLTVQREASEQFLLLKSKYTDSLTLDQYLEVLVEKVGETWYGLGQPKAGNPFNLFSTLFGGGGEDFLD